MNPYLPAIRTRKLNHIKAKHRELVTFINDDFWIEIEIFFLTIGLQVENELLLRPKWLRPAPAEGEPFINFVTRIVRW